MRIPDINRIDRAAEFLQRAEEILSKVWLRLGEDSFEFKELDFHLDHLKEVKENLVNFTISERKKQFATKTD